MANTITGQLVICVSDKAATTQIAAFKNFAAFELNKVITDSSVAEKIYQKALVVAVPAMTEKVKQGEKIKEYPTSPFKLVIDHNSKVPFSVNEEGTRIGIRFETNLTKLGLLDPVVINMEQKDRKAYAGRDLSFVSDEDKKGLARLGKLGYIAENLFQWKQTTRELITQAGFDLKDVSKYNLKEVLGGDRPHVAPYCVTLPESDSAIVLFVVKKTGEAGNTYYVQDFTRHWNVGLTHTGQSGEEIDPKAAKQLLAELAAASK